MEDIKKEVKFFDNSMFKERFQFILSINENIICQRYFKINGFVNESLSSEEFIYTMRECVNEIKNDLIAKSRIYMWYTNEDEPTKLTGFAKESDYDHETLLALTNTDIEGEVTVGGKTYDKTYFTYPKSEDVNEDEKPQENEFVFRFAFLIDDETVYEEVWDGNVYPKYIRNSVDLSNSDVAYRGKDPMSLQFSLAIIRHLTVDRKDLIFYIIKKIQEVCSSTFANTYGDYTKKVVYGNTDKEQSDKTYYYSTYNYNYVKGWRKATETKTRQYESWVNCNFSPNYLERIDKKF